MGRLTAGELKILRVFDGDTEKSLTSGVLATRAGIITGAADLVLTRLANQKFLTAAPHENTRVFTLTAKGRSAVSGLTPPEA